LASILNFAAISWLTIFFTLGAILLVIAVWLIVKIILQEPGKRKSELDMIRKRYFNGEIDEENFDGRLHHLM